LTFALPSHLTELLGFPPEPADPVDVPDSVEVCDVSDFCPDLMHPVLNFARASKLARLASPVTAVNPETRVFLQTTSASAKRFRSGLEFEDGSSDSRRRRSECAANDFDHWSLEDGTGDASRIPSSEFEYEGQSEYD
jgi:hypothetical protein